MELLLLFSCATLSNKHYYSFNHTSQGPFYQNFINNFPSRDLKQISTKAFLKLDQTLLFVPSNLDFGNALVLENPSLNIYFFFFKKLLLVVFYYLLFVSLWFMISFAFKL